MRPWLVGPLLVATGCLYLGRVNQPPTITLDAQTTNAYKGATIVFTAHPQDDEDPASELAVTFTVRDATTQQPLDPSCDYHGSDANGHPVYSVTFLRTGVFSVEAQTQDHRGAPSGTATVMVTISDAPPLFKDGSMLVPTSPRNFCNSNTAGDVITLGLSGHVYDPDAVTNCSGAPPWSLTWRITAAPSGANPVLTRLEGGACDAPTAASGPALTVGDDKTQVCLWTDAALMSGTAMYTIVLEASDGTTVVTSPALDVPVAANMLPCITGTNPAVGSYVVDRTQLQSFEVTSAVDDRDVFGASDKPITFVWSVSSKSDPTWRDVPDWTSPTYTLDPSTFGVDEIVHVRVEAIDDSGVRAPPSLCSPSASDCDIASCALAGLCHKWRTWDLELR